ncbi:MAG: metalloregulator ArsR/SmtB family transcription factor [Pseudomonadota bacterium]
MNEAQAAPRFAALSDPSRLAILRALVRAGPEGLAAGRIADALEASPSRTSFHLAKLTDAGLVASRRDARTIIYTMRFDALGTLLDWLVEDCCAGSETLRARNR